MTLTHRLRGVILLVPILLLHACANAQNPPAVSELKSLVYSQAELNQMMLKRNGGSISITL